MLLNFIAKILTDDKSIMIPEMAWCYAATIHYLNQCWPATMWLYGVLLGHNELIHQSELKINHKQV